MANARAAAKRLLRSVRLLDPAERLARWMRQHGALERRKHEALVAFYRRFIEPGALCFDIGANWGNRTRVFLDIGRVVAVEPHPQCAAALRRRFGRSPDFTLVEAAAGASPGEAELHVGPITNLSTLSQRYMRETRNSGRFDESAWSDSRKVAVTTLDELIGKYGVPAFCKIDVEGYEPEVLMGLGSAVPLLSFEFTAPESIADAIRCVERLEHLGRYRYNLSYSESLELELETWVSGHEIMERLRSIDQPESWGDIYARHEAARA